MPKDFFISYTHTDKHWAEWIAWTLEESGYTLVFQQWDFKPGTNFVVNMQSALQECDKVIAVVSSRYLDAAFPVAEWAAAFRNDPTGKSGRLLPIKIDSSKPDGLLAQIVYVDLSGLSAQAARNSLLNAANFARQKPTRPPVFPGKGNERVLGLDQPDFPGATPEVVSELNPLPAASQVRQTVPSVFVEVLVPTEILATEEHHVRLDLTVTGRATSLAVEVKQDGFLIASTDPGETDRFVLAFRSPGKYTRWLSIRAREARSSNHRIMLTCFDEDNRILTRNAYVIRVAEATSGLKLLGVIRSLMQHPRLAVTVASFALLGAVASATSGQWSGMLSGLRFPSLDKQLEAERAFSLAEVERQVFGDEDNQETRKGKIGFEQIAFSLALNPLPITGDSATTSAGKLSEHLGIYYQADKGVLKVQTFDFPAGAKQLRAVAVGNDPKRDYIPNSWVFVSTPNGPKQIHRRRSADGVQFYALSDAVNAKKIFVVAVYDQAVAFYRNSEQIWIEVNDLAGSISKTRVMFGGKVKNIEFRSVLQCKPEWPIVFRSLPLENSRVFPASRQQALSEAAALFAVFDSDKKVQQVAPDQISWQAALDFWSELRTGENEEWRGIEMDELSGETLIIAKGEPMIPAGKSVAQK